MEHLGPPIDGSKVDVRPDPQPPSEELKKRLLDQHRKSHPQHAPNTPGAVMAPGTPQPTRQEMQPPPPDRTDSFELASHRNVVIRVIKGTIERILSDQQLLRQGKIIDRALSKIIIELDGATEITERDTATMYTADRIHAMVRAHLLTYGDTVKFTTYCPNRGCRNPNESVVSIETDILPTLVMFGEQREFERTLPTGKVVVFGYSTGLNERNLSNALNPTMMELMLLRLRKVNGQPATLLHLEAMDGCDLKTLREYYKETRTGVDTEVKVFCEKCPMVYTVRLEGQINFFFPGAE